MTVTVCVRPCARGVGRQSESESAWGRGHGRGRAIRDEWTLWRAVVVVVVVGGWDGGVWLKPGSMTLVPRNPAEPHDTMALLQLSLSSSCIHSQLHTLYRPQEVTRLSQISDISIAWIKELSVPVPRLRTVRTDSSSSNELSLQ